MPSPPLAGFGTSMDTQKTIQQLLEIERRPLKRIELDNQRNTVVIKAWEELRKKTRTLADRSSAIYSFAGAFAAKTIVSSDPGAVTGQASPEVENQEMQVEVVKLATEQKIHSCAISPEKDLPAGKFSIAVGDKTLDYDFEGGKISALVRLMRQKSGSLIDINQVNKDSANSLIVFRSKTSGSKGKIEFKGEGPLAEIGLNAVGTGGAEEVEKPEDAVIKLHGVEISRPSNDNITDVIEGASLSLRKKTTGPVTLKVQSNSDAIEKQVQDWLAAYNELMQFCRENSKTVSKDEFERNRPSSEDDVGEGLRRLQASAGIFAADNNVRQLVATLQGITAASYPSNRENGFRVLSDIGISTGAPGQNIDDNRFGYLALDSAIFRKAVQDNPAAVKDLFAMDSNEDAVMDTGVAFRTQAALAPYHRQTGGIITARIDLLKSGIADNKERIRKKEMSLVGTEASLRQRFGRMESAIRQHKSMSNSLSGMSRGGESE